MPIDKPKPGETQEHYLAYCIKEEMSNGMEQDQASAACYSYWDKGNMAEVNIPIEIIGDNEEKILEYLPEPKANEQEDAYLNRCVPCLYPKYYDQTQATALCADKLQRKTTVTNLKRIAELRRAVKSMRNFR
jgi:hypothetical protein